MYCVHDYVMCAYMPDVHSLFDESIVKQKQFYLNHSRFFTERSPLMKDRLAAEKQVLISMSVVVMLETQVN